MELLGCLGAIIVVVAASILNGWVLSVMWGWFVVTAFNAPPLSVPAAIGVGMVVSFLTAKRQTESKKGGWEDLTGELLFAVFYPLAALALGYIVYLFI